MKPPTYTRNDPSIPRTHVTDPAMWGVQAGTDFWLHAGGLNISAGRTLITDGGWTATSLSIVAGTGASFIDKTNLGTPAQYLQNAAADLLQSQAIFGDYEHSKLAATIAGQKSLPRYLCMEALAAFNTASANEVTTNLGFVEAGGSIVVAADTLATFYSGGTGASWGCQSNAAVVAGTTTVSTTPHTFRIVMDKVTGYSNFYIDGVYQNQLAITSAVLPCSFGAGAGTTNRIFLSWAHIWYAWKLPNNAQF